MEDQRSLIHENKNDIFSTCQNNLGIISAGATVISTLLAATFLYGYMKNFGISFLIIFEPSDIFKFIVFSASFIATLVTSLGLIHTVTQFFYKDFFIDRKQRKKLRLFFIFQLTLWGYFFYINLIIYPSLKPRELIILTLTIWVIFEFFYFIQDNSHFNIGGLFFQITLMLIITFLDGYFIGLHIKEYGSVVDVEFKEGDNNFDVLRNTKIVMILSHHAILYKDNKTIVMPISEISRITKTMD